MDNSSKQTTQNTSSLEPKVTGIGGIFFLSDNPTAMKEWYVKNLGVSLNEWGSVSFETRNIDRPEQIIPQQWLPFKRDSDYFAPSTKDYMINYTVQNIEGLAEKLKANGVRLVDEIVSYDFGKFVHCMDAEGNKIELWEPVS